MGNSGQVLNWGGFNTLLRRNHILKSAKISYLTAIPASPTNYDTVLTILRRSVAIAEELHIPSITLVFNKAIYVKVQDFRWQEKTFYDRTLVRLGEFHTCLAILEVIGKQFRHAGFFDILVEAGVVAVGSVNAVLDGKQYNSRGMLAHKIVGEAMQ